MFSFGGKHRPPHRTPVPLDRDGECRSLGDVEPGHLFPDRRLNKQRSRSFRPMNAYVSRPRLLNVVTSALMAGKLPGQMQYLHERGFEVTVISPGGEGLDQMARTEGVRAI